MHHRVLSAVTKEDFKIVKQESLEYVDVEPDVNQWTYDNAIKAVKANANRGYFRFYLGRVAVGDVINVRAEVYSVEGVKVHASVDLSDYGWGFEKGSSGLVNAKQLGEWELIDFDYQVNTDANFASAVIGLSTGEIGQYFLKNVVITVKSLLNATYGARRIVGAVLQKTSGTWGLNVAFVNSQCTISVLDANTLRVIFTELSSETMWSMAWTSQEYHNNDYIIRVKSSGAGIVDIRFRNPIDNTTVPIASIANQTSFVLYAMS